MELIEEEDRYFDGKVLFKRARDGQWRAVVDMYRKYPLARIAKVTQAKNTVLHLAVLKEDDNLVEQLVNTIKEEAHHVLSLQNNLGNTPLHVAAALGLPRICWLLAEKCKELVVMARNTAGETPLYIAARHGKKRTFFVLQDFVPETLMESTLERTLRFCQRKDGNTILHAAVHGEYFGLAIEIITLYPRLVNFYNEIGQTPLHLLANMPLAFKSACRLRGIDNLIYSCIIVDRLKPKYKPRIYEGQLNGWKKEKKINMSKDYATFMNLFQLLHQLLHRLLHHTDRQDEFWNHIRTLRSPIQILEIFKYTLINTVTAVMFELLTPGEFGIPRRHALMREKIKHEHASQVMEELVHCASYWEYGEDEPIKEKLDSPILIAAKQGVVEMVKSILNNFPEAAQDFDSNHKNIVLLSAEHRQMQVYKHLLERKPMLESFFEMVDKDGNTPLHLVARLATTDQSWLFKKNVFFQMQWECEWYKFVENSVEPGFFQEYNNMGETAMEILSKSHESLAMEGGQWLINISQYCSVVAVLVVGVAYASATTVPGGLNQTTGFPILAKKSTFKWFAWSAVAALCLSIVSLFMFLIILASSFKVNEFRRKLPDQLSMGIRLLIMSVIIMLLSFINGFFAMEYKHNTYVYYIDALLLLYAFAAFGAVYLPKIDEA